MSDMPTTAKAAILVEQNKDLVIGEITLPKTLDIGQVLVKIRYSGICGSQLGEIDGVKGPDPWLPHLLGHEGSGHAVAVGPGVKHVKPGDAVVLHWRPSKGIEATPAKYSWNGKVVNAGWVTTFNDHAVIAENRLTAIPAGTDLKAAALYGCAVTTGFGVIDNRAKIKLGESVVVFGAGGIGLNIVQGAALAGARTIVAVDRYANRLELARHCGATETIDGSKTGSISLVSASATCPSWRGPRSSRASIVCLQRLTSSSVAMSIRVMGYDGCVMTLTIRMEHVSRLPFALASRSEIPPWKSC